MRKPTLLDLPYDVQSRIMQLLMHPIVVSGTERIVERCFSRALSLAYTCKSLYQIFHMQLKHCELWQSSRLTDRGLISIARNSSTAIRTLILRKCTLLSAHSLRQVAISCTKLSVLDLSHLTICDTDLSFILSRIGRLLRALHLRECAQLTDVSLRAIGEYCAESRLCILDVCGLTRVSDAGIEAALCTTAGSCIRTLVISRCKQLGDDALCSIARNCVQLEILTCRELPMVTDLGIRQICERIGKRLCTLDVLDCEQLQISPFLECIRRYCPKLKKKFVDDVAYGTRSLRQAVISSLAGFIFHVTGSDIHNGKPAVYFLLVDAGSSDRFRVSIGSSSLDLTNFGCILASCFGDEPNQHVKDTMLIQYGLDLSNATEQSE